MNLFAKQPPVPSQEQISHIKQWVDQRLRLNGAVPISVSQRRCHQPDCPPVETVISVMTQPTQTYRVHRPIMEVDSDGCWLRSNNTRVLLLSMVHN